MDSLRQHRTVRFVPLLSAIPSGSRLNQVELWFSKIEGDAIGRGGSLRCIT